MIYLILLSYYIHSISYYSTSYISYPLCYKKICHLGPLTFQGESGRPAGPRKGARTGRRGWAARRSRTLCVRTEPCRSGPDWSTERWGHPFCKSWNGMKMGWNIGSPSDKSPVDTVQWSKLSIHFSVSTSCWGGHRHIPHFDWRASLCRPGVTFDEMGHLFEAPWNHRTQMANIWIVSVLWENGAEQGFS